MTKRSSAKSKTSAQRTPDPTRSCFVAEWKPSKGVERVQYDPDNDAFFWAVTDDRGDFTDHRKITVAEMFEWWTAKRESLNGVLNEFGGATVARHKVVQALKKGGAR